jgi:hypothetical protein
MYIPIDRDQNPYSPNSEKLFGVLYVPKPPLDLPAYSGTPWPAVCKPSGDLEEACCRAGYAAGSRLKDMVGKIADLTVDLAKEKGHPAWEDFLGKNLVARQHYIDFALEFEGLLNFFSFDLKSNNNLFTFPLNDTYSFERLHSAGVPKISGNICFESDRKTGIPLKFSLKAWLSEKPRLDGSSVSSSFGTRSSSSIPWLTGGRSGNRGPVITPPPNKSRGSVVNPSPAKK